MDFKGLVGCRLLFLGSGYLKNYRHSCCSHGTPSPLPSIFVPAQFRRNHVASSQEVICEQCVLPSQRYLDALDVAENGAAFGVFGCLGVNLAAANW